MPTEEQERIAEHWCRAKCPYPDYPNEICLKPKGHDGLCWTPITTLTWTK